MDWFTETKYVDHAEQVIGSLQKNQSGGFALTTTQIRNLLSLSAAVYDKAEVLDSSELSEDIKSDLNYLRIQFVYQSGRTKSVDDFVKKTGLIDLLKEITDKAKVIRFCRYMESLVAYFKYQGGKD